MIGYQPEPGAANCDAIAWDIVQVLISSGLPMISYEPLDGASNFEMLLWDILQNIGGGGGGGLPPGSDGDLLNYTSGSWSAQSITQDSAGVNSFDNNARALFDLTAVDSVNASNRVLSNRFGAPAVDWDTAKLYTDANDEILDWERGYLLIATSGNIRFDWTNGVLNGNSNDVAISIPNRQIFDSGGFTSINAQVRVLYDAQGSPVFNWGDVSNSGQSYFYSGFKIGFGNYGTDANLTHPVTIGTPGLRIQGMAGAAAGGGDIGSITVNIDGTDRKINYKA